MKAKLLAANHTCLFFGATLYVGVLWSLHFFWFPTWTSLTVENYMSQFIGPTDAATRFFTVVVPLMLLTNIVLIATEWRTRFRWFGVAAFVFIAAATIDGTMFIIPINRTIKAGVADQAVLSAHLERWMFLNDIRMVLLTGMWLTLMGYFIGKGGLLQKLGGPPK